jgi:hypothetical protein
MKFGTTIRFHSIGLTLLWLLLAQCHLQIWAFPTASAHTSNSVRDYLNPNTGRFWTMDSYEGNDIDPLSLHKYLYCKANSVSMTDASGYFGEDMDIDIMVEGMESTEAIGAQAVEKCAISKIQQIGLGLAASALLAEELGLTGGDIIDTIQTQTVQRANPTKSANAYENYRCTFFARDAMQYFQRNGENPKIITYDSYPGKTWRDYICAADGFGLFGGDNVSINGHHEGVLVNGEVYDNNVPFGVPRALWEAGYEINPVDNIGSYLNLREADTMKYGKIKP